MQAIRSVLWIGEPSSLPAEAISTAPWLDVIWEPDLLRALGLPPSRFDAVVLVVDDPDRALIGIVDLHEAAESTPLLVLGPTQVLEAADELHRAGAHSIAPLESGSDLAKLLDWLAPRTAGHRAPVPSTSDGADLGLLGDSRGMRALRKRIQRIARSDASVLILGESGTGKERTARAIHELGRRRAGPFIALNCGALPDTLLEAELQGAARGAYTGADRDRPGLVEEADGGTLFLDEIAEASASFQIALLRVLQERVIRPLGAREERRVDVRIIAATHRDLRRDIAEKRFRADLYYRLRVLPIELPPLRERVDDIAPLAAHFLERFASAESKTTPRLAPEALRRLEIHTWPGNVRELENELHRAVALADGPELLPDDLSLELGEPACLAQDAWAQRPPGEALTDTLARLEAWILRRALEAHAGRRADTARSLGLTREGLYKKLKRLGID